MIGQFAVARDRNALSIGTVASYAIVLAYACYMWGALIHAGWGVIDDHEIMWMIGDHARLAPNRVADVLAHTELAPDSTLARFRPAYFVLRAFEAVVWGKSATLWYVARVGIALLLGVTLMFFCLPFAGPLLTAAFAIFAMSAPYWGDIFARAGPAETYVVLGVCVMLLAWGREPRRTLTLGPALALALGVVIASGSKENMLVLGVVPFWLMFSRRVRVTMAARVPLLLSLAFMAWIAITVMSRVESAGVDIYNRDASLHGRAVVLLSLLQRPAIQHWIEALVMIGVACWLTRSHARDANPLSAKSILHRQYRQCLLVGAVMLVIYAGQVVFYTGVWPYGQNLPGRYLFPGLISQHLMLLLGSVLIINSLRCYVPGDRLRMIVVNVATVGLSAAFLVNASHRFGVNREASLTTVRNTQQFQMSLARIDAALRAKPHEALVLNVYSVWNIEPVVSVFRFVRAAGIRNPIALVTNGLSPEKFPKGSIEQTLTTQLDQMSRGEFDALATTANSAVDQQRCYSVGFDGPPLATCQGGFTIWPQ